MHRSLLAAPIAALFLGGLTGIASAQDDPPGLTAQLCAAASADEANALLAANLDVGLPAGVRDAVNPGQLAGPLEDAQTTLGCAPEETVTPDPTDTSEPSADSTTEAPNPTETQSPTDRPDVPLYADCAEAREFGAAPIAVGDPGYRAELDSDSDGTACESEDSDSLGNTPTGDDTLGGTNDSNSGIVNSVPRGPVDTGFVA